MKLEKITIALIALSLSLPMNCTAFAEDIACDASVIDVVSVGADEGDSAPTADVYAAIDGLLEATAGSVFEVFRPSEVNKESARHYPLMLYVGRLVTIGIQDEVIVGRMIEFASNSEHPRVRYADVMIGDCLRLEPVEEAVSEAVEEPALEEALPIVPEEPPPAMRTIPSKVLFDFDSAVVQEKGSDDLAQLAEYIAREKPERVIVEGHACWIGSDEYNMGLSERRARAVVDYLATTHALDRNIFEVEAYGESLPKASNETPEGREENRRAAASVLFRVVPTTRLPTDSRDLSLEIGPEDLRPDNVETPRISAAPPLMEEIPEEL